MFCYGIVLALLGALFGLSAFRERVGMSFQQQGVILGIVYLGVWLTTPMVGPVIDRFGNKLVLLSATLLVTVSLFGFVLVQSFVQAVAAALILGFGGGGLNTSTNALVSDVFGAERGPYLNYLGIFYGLGALFTPLLASTISQRLTELILFVAYFCAACALAFALLRFPPAREAHSFALKDAMRVAVYPGVVLFALLLFFESGNEAVITGFASRYAESLGASTRVAAWALTAYLGALIFGRVLAGQVLRRISKAQLVLSCAAASLGSYALFVFAGSVALTILFAGLVGFCFSA